MENWENKIQVKKGNFGEFLVDKEIKEMGLIPYQPIFEGAHPFDRLCIADNNSLAIVECKTKPKRLYFEDTGFNYSQYKIYCDIRSKHNLEIWIFFIDQDKKEIYGNTLFELEKPCVISGKKYPSIEKGIIYFPIKNMDFLVEINKRDCDKLKKLSTSNY